MKKTIRKIMSSAIIIGFMLTIGYKVMPSKAATLSGYTSTEIVAMMDKGFNIGNTLDATGGNRTSLTSQETSWGNPAITRELIAGIKAAGFNTVRIPTTWYKHVTKEDGYKIDEEWMEHIKEIVDWAYENELFVILNLHHESWLNVSNLGDNYVEIGEELSAIWAQIADAFADYDQHLIFEGMNEPRAAGTSYEWTGTEKEYEAVNYLNQLFVDAVRNNGKGYNNERALMVPAYAASSSESILKALKLPERNGETAENLIVSVHCYNPYNFCLSDEQSTFNPKNSADTSGITSMFRALKSLFIDNGIPVIVGECGCTNTNDNLEARLLWFDYFGRKASEYGTPAIVWDNGAKGKSGGECHNYFNRKTGEATSQDLIDAFILGYTPGPKEAESQTITFEPVKQDGSTIIITPAEAGFLPKDLSCQMKINHTIDATTGFALKIQPSTKDQTASFNLEGYIGKDIIVTGYVYSDESCSVTFGYDDGTKKEVGSVEANTNWNKFAMRMTVGEAETIAYVTGEENKTFYMDDFSITIVDENTDVEALMDVSGNVAGSMSENNSDTDSDTSGIQTGTDQNDGVNSEETANDSVTEGSSGSSSQTPTNAEQTASGSDNSSSGSTSVSPWIFILIPILILGIIVFVIIRKKKN